MNERILSLKTNPAELSSVDLANIHQWTPTPDYGLPQHMGEPLRVPMAAE
jgi:hypothetical protein